MTKSGSAAGEVFKRNPYNVDGRLLFYAPSIGTDAGFADIIIEQVHRVQTVQAWNPGGMRGN